MKTLRLLLSMVAVVIITTLGVGASDVWRSQSSSLLALVVGSKETRCLAGMSPVPTALTFSCIDTYEVSPAASCVYQSTTNGDQSVSNAADPNCLPQSVSGVVPWRFVTRADAALACARAGKRLPTAAEWYIASQGTKPENCTTQTTVVGLAGARPACVSVYKATDMIGNVWEWVSDDVISGIYQGRALPQSGYVAQFDSGGVPTITAVAATTLTDLGYFWSDPNGSFGMIRGGFYGSKRDSGQATIQAATSPNFAGAAIGFRCVE